MSFLSNLLTGGAGELIKSVGEVAGQFITTDKERDAAKLEQDKLGLQEVQAYLGDTQDARHMQIAALQQDDVFSKRFVYFFATAWSAFAMIYLIIVTFVNIPDKNLRMVDTILGFLLGTAVASIFNFFLGTNAQSRNKDQTISALAKGK